eukprot:2586419-Amphidinium_carterae.2
MARPNVTSRVLCYNIKARKWWLTSATAFSGLEIFLQQHGWSNNQGNMYDNLNSGGLTSQYNVAVTIYEQIVLSPLVNFVEWVYLR